MSDLKRIEEHIQQLINMVAKNNELTLELSEKVSNIEKRLDIHEELNKARFDELVKELRTTKYEIDHLRNKTSKNEMDIDVVKNMIQS